MIRVLVVEDEQHLAEGLRFNLEAEGYQVQVVKTGEAALQLLTTELAPFDVVILDVMLPGKDGFAVMSEMRQAGLFIPTLMLTARSESADVLRGFAAGADDYLTKPFELAILIARIHGLSRRLEWLRGPSSKIVHIRRQILPFRPLGTSCSRAGISAHADGSERSPIFDRA
jgi:two-component system, OmpR family, alkaline phosphatase synthesis response regulator PhoP